MPGQDRGSLPAERGPLFHGGAQQGAGADIGQAEPLGEPPPLGPLAGCRRPEEDEALEDEPNQVEQMTFMSQALPVLPPEGLSLKHRLAEIERDLIAQALSRTNGNVSQTARILNVQRTTLIEKIQKFGLREGV